MKKTVFTALAIPALTGLLYAGGISFAGYFPGIPAYKASFTEKPDEFENAGVQIAQTRYTHDSGSKWVIVSCTLGKDVEGSPSMPPGYSMNQGGIIIQVKTMQGFTCLYTYYTMQKKGNIITYMPANQRQKYNGMVTFSFTNTPKGEADALMAKFNLKKFQKRMETLQ